MNNKYQEALENIVWEIRISRRNPKNIEDIKVNLDLLQELVDKATPKKILKNNNDECQNCGTWFDSAQEDYCHNCGQALDWSEDE